MNDAEALEEAKRLARGGQIAVSQHAADRMDERGVSRLDVIEAVVTANSARYQSDRDNWVLTGGVDLVGDRLTIVADFVGHLLVITIF